MDCLSGGNLSWPRQNISTKGNMKKVRNLFFVATNGWVNSFVRRNDFSLCRKTATAQQDPERLIDKIILHNFHAHTLSVKYKYPLSSIIAMDETSVWNDMVSNATTNKQGAKSVSLKTTGHEKCMVSVCFSVKTN